MLEIRHVVRETGHQPAVQRQRRPRNVGSASAKITTLASVAQLWHTPDDFLSKADATELCIYLNPENFYAHDWKSTGFTHPVTGEAVHMAQVTFFWTEAQAYRRAAKVVEARYIQYKVAKRQKLVALKHALLREQCMMRSRQQICQTLPSTLQ